MGFWDQVKDAASGVAKSTSSLYDKGVAKVGISQMQGQIRDLYREYGEYCYNSEKSGAVDEARKAELTGQIDACFAKIAEIEAEQEAARQQAELEAAERAEKRRLEAEQRAAQQAASAAAAAARVAAAQQAAGLSSEVEFCPECGTQVAAGSAFCGSCGTKLR